jgi:hypothetical protein
VSVDKSHNSLSENPHIGPQSIKLLLLLLLLFLWFYSPLLDLGRFFQFLLPIHSR